MLSDNQGLLFDDRDGEVYGTVQIGGQEWMAENLRFRCMESAPYDSDESLVPMYGCLYSWTAIAEAIPSGWHLPSLLEWEELLWSAGAFELERTAKIVEYKRIAPSLKTSRFWQVDKDFSTTSGDDLRFSVLPAGIYRRGLFSEFGKSCEFWSATRFYDKACTFSFHNFSSSVYRSVSPIDDSTALSIRCVRD
ncbi:MAG: hypothetical protein MJY47_04825 [Fibrobacter sp.]|nr:hypothetical protein [Fibrobacter sp.]